MKKALVLTSVLMFIQSFSSSFSMAASGLNETQVIRHLLDEGYMPLIINYRNLCHDKESSFSHLSNELQSICGIVTKSDMCKEVDEKDLLKCDLVKNTKQPHIELWEFLKGCTHGLFESTKDMLKFVWDLLKWILRNSISRKELGKTIKPALEFFNMAKLYLHTEFEKAYEKVSSPFRSVKAIAKIGKQTGKVILDRISRMITQKFQEYGCLNYEAKTKVLCKFIGDIFIPPAAGMALVKVGFKKAFAKFPMLIKAFERLNELRKIKGKASEEVEKFRIDDLDVMDVQTLTIEQIIEEKEQ